MANRLKMPNPTRRNFVVGGALGLLTSQVAARPGVATVLEPDKITPSVDKVFLPSTVDPATRRVNALLEATRLDMNEMGLDGIRKLFSGPPQWPADIAAAGTSGLRLLPMPPQVAVGKKIIPGPCAEGIRIIVLQPPGRARGTYFYVHGGGWIAQKPEDYLGFLWRICREAEVAVVATSYRLAPEHPFPAGPDDVLAAASWLFQSGQTEFKAPFVIGGDSAGGHLAALTLQRLRDERGLVPFVGADLIFGVYDLNLTPSARLKGAVAPLTTAMVQQCVDWACLKVSDRLSPKVSPLYGSIDGLPPALFTIGTADPLLDDTLFMHERWRSAGRPSILQIYPGGVHGFEWYPLAIGVEAIDRRIGFIAERMRAA